MSDTPTTEQLVERVQHGLGPAELTRGPVTQREYEDACTALAALQARIEELERRPSWTIVNEWRKQAERTEAERDVLLAKCEDYLLWEPRKRGHAEAHKSLSLFVRKFRAALSEEPRAAGHARDSGKTLDFTRGEVSEEPRQ